jgi:hypothetical protein
MLETWWNIGMLAVESQQVMWLRCMRLAAGLNASAEAMRMVTEKLALAEPATNGILMGNSTRVLKRYRKTVRANRRRLSRWPAVSEV